MVNSACRLDILARHELNSRHRTTRWRCGATDTDTAVAAAGHRQRIMRADNVLGQLAN